MNILPEVEIIDLFLYLKEHETLVIGDAHLGYEESLRQKGILLPKFQFNEIMERVANVLEVKKPKKIIIVGDLKHEFSRISNEEWRQARKFIELLQKYGEIIIIKGNHDTILKPLVDKFGLDLHDHYVVGDMYLCHGHNLPEDLDYSKSKTVIMGHEHPAVGLKDGPRVEYYKCFLRGKHKGKTVVVMPSLSSMPEGSDVTKEKLLSPFLKDIKNFEVFVAADKVYKFGKVKTIGKLS